MTERMQAHKADTQQSRAYMTAQESDRLAEEGANRQAQQRSKREQAAETIAEIDELLDEIDLVLEDTEIVQNYVQRGGQ